MSRQRDNSTPNAMVADLYTGDSGSPSKEAEAPIQGIDWGPDPEPVYSS